MDKLFNPDYIYHLCQKYGLRPSKQYGQNYLLDSEVIDFMIEAGKIGKNDTVVEVGPGFGVLTLPLCTKAGKVIAYEIEKKIKEYWDEKIKEYKNLEVIWGNVIYSDKLSIRNYKVVANLPYQITSQLLRFFLEAENKPKKMVLMVQKEVAQRICAPKGDLSVLGIAVQYYADPKILAIVSKNSFYPVPKVDSAVIELNVKDKTFLNKKEEIEFFKLVRAGFLNRRKFLIKNLENYLGKKNREKLGEIFSKLNFSDKIRAQELEVEDWIRLFKERGL